MNSLDPNILIEISTKIASIDERTKSLQQADTQAQTNADHRHRNVMAAIENFVPRREIESENANIRRYAEHLAETTKSHCDQNREVIVARVERIEGTIKGFTDDATKVKWTIFAAVGSATVSGLGYVAHLIWQIVSKTPLVP